QHHRRAQHLPHREPAEREVADVLVRQPVELDEKAEHAVAGQEQAGNRHRRTRLRRERPQDDEEHEPLEQRFVELRRMAPDAADVEAPGHVGRLAPQLAVDEVADTPEAEPGRHERCQEIAHLEKAAPDAPAEQPDGDDDAEQAAVERHAAFPDTKHVQRIGEQPVPGVNEAVAEPAAHDHADHRVENEVVHLCGADRGMGTRGASTGQPPAEHEPDHVHQPVPPELQRPDREDDRIDVGVWQHGPLVYRSRRGHCSQPRAGAPATRKRYSGVMASPPPNRLARETSPYLLQHAGNPVDWFPWGEEALDLARRSGKPILLSVGYSACHWCHVMAHESFEDPETAAVMNELFVNVKVDREERPDIDRVYQTAHQLLAQRPGGWPLTVFLDPEDQRPFFAGTYFPKEPRYGMPPFRDLLVRVRQWFDENREEVRAQNRRLQAVLDRLEPAPGERAPLSDAPLRVARERIAHAFDNQSGGFGDAPKFPQPSGLDYLLRYWRASALGEDPDTQALYMVSLTLVRMAEGGLQDHVGGGFFRYSVDRFWRIPHFEKMLYDNGALLALYAHAHLATGEPLFARAANDCADWLLGDMRSPEGGFYSSRDADSEGEEGRYYVWTRDEIEALLPADELR